MFQWLRGVLGERRSLVNLANPKDPVLADWFGGPSTNSGTYISPETAMRVTAVRACVSLISGLVARLPLFVMSEDAAGDRERANDLPIFGLLKDRPNKFQTSYQWRKMMMRHFLLRGAAYSEIVSSGGAGVAELRPLHPDRTIPFWTDSGEIAFGYTPLNGPRRVILASEMFYLMDEVSRDDLEAPFLRPVSRIRSCAEAIGIAMAAEGYAASFFGRDARAGTVLKHKGKLSPEAKLNLEKDWDTKYGGWQRSHKTTVLVGEVDIETLGMTNEDAQFIQSRGLQAVEICRIFDIPPHMIGETDKSTSWGSGIEQMTLGFVKFNLATHLEMWSQALKRDVLPADRRGLSYLANFAIDELTRPDFKTYREGLAAEVQSSIASVDEVRRELGRGPVPGGKRRFMSLNSTMIDEKTGDPMPLPPRANPDQPKRGE